MIEIKKGLDLPIVGAPSTSIDSSKKVTQVAVLGQDYVGMKPTMLVQAGDRVKKGQALFSDKKNEGVVFTAPAAGIIKDINRGEKRKLLSVVIEIEGDDAETFNQYNPTELSQLSAEQVQDNLVRSGLWTALRTRPYSRSPKLGSTPAAILVNAMDTRPLAADPTIFINQHSDAFKYGLQAMSVMAAGELYVCQAPDANVPTAGVEKTETFAGLHPAGLSGTHAHFLAPVSEQKTIWTINAQDVVAIGYLFTQGELFSERLISVAGPQVSNPRLMSTLVGANINELLDGELVEDENRVISGSVFGGRKVEAHTEFLSRFDNQITVIREGRERPMLHYFTPGVNRFSVMPIYLSKLLKKTFAFSSSTNGSERAMVPIGAYERIMPLDILPTQLLRALIVEDMETAIALGALELDEEDLALCSFVCPGKYEYGPILRKNLTRIEAEG